MYAASAVSNIVAHQMHNLVGTLHRRVWHKPEEIRGLRQTSEDGHIRRCSFLELYLSNISLMIECNAASDGVVISFLESLVAYLSCLLSAAIFLPGRLALTIETLHALKFGGMHLTGPL